MQANNIAPTPVYTVCPRRKPGDSSPVAGSTQVAITFQLLKPYFNKPLTEASEELGLSATAIKKACRKFGIPKWPFRTLTSKSSRNRSAFQAISLKLTAQAQSAAPSMPVQEEEQQQPAARPAEYLEAPVVYEEEDSFSHSVGSFTFDQFSGASSPMGEFADGEFEDSENATWEHAVSSPLEPIEDEQEAKQKADNWLFDKLRPTADDFQKFLCASDSFEEEQIPVESFDSGLFSWNTM